MNEELVDISTVTIHLDYDKYGTGIFLDVFLS